MRTRVEQHGGHLWGMRASPTQFRMGVMNENELMNIMVLTLHCVLRTSNQRWNDG